MRAPETQLVTRVLLDCSSRTVATTSDSVHGELLPSVFTSPLQKAAKPIKRVRLLGRSNSTARS